MPPLALHFAGEPGAPGLTGAASCGYPLEDRVPGLSLASGYENGVVNLRRILRTLVCFPGLIFRDAPYCPTPLARYMASNTTWLAIVFGLTCLSLRPQQLALSSTACLLCGSAAQSQSFSCT